MGHLRNYDSRSDHVAWTQGHGKTGGMCINAHKGKTNCNRKNMFGIEIRETNEGKETGLMEGR
jgi:hypothetical protein